MVDDDDDGDNDSELLAPRLSYTMCKFKVN